MEIPTTSNVDLLTEFHEVFNNYVRPVAERELSNMEPAQATYYADKRETLLPSSIVIDTFLYLSHHLSEMAAEEIVDAQQSGDINKLIDTCDSYDPYWKAARSLSLALKVFAQELDKGNP